MGKEMKVAKHVKNHGMCVDSAEYQIGSASVESKMRLKGMSDTELSEFHNDLLRCTCS